MNVFKFLLVSSTLCLMLTSCQEDFMISAPEEVDIVDDSKSYPNVDTELWVFFENFEKAAALRGIDVDLAAERISGTIENIDEADVAGVCSYGGFSPGKIVIDDNFWARAGNDSKEMIVFHELGHCFLFRDHLEGRLDNGNCKSIMRSGLERCRDAYFAVNKEYYQDELFSVNNRRN